MNATARAGTRFAFLLARLGVGIYAVLTAAYCLLAFIPFTYEQVYVGALLPWLTEFARLHSYLYWLALVAAVLTLPDLRNDRTRFWTVLFVLVHGAVGFNFWWHPLLLGLGNDNRSLQWALLALSPLAWLAALDWRARADELPAKSAAINDTRQLLCASLFSGISLCLISTAAVGLRQAGGENVPLSGRQWALALAGSLVAYVAVALAVFLALNFLGTAARLISRRTGVQAAIHVAMGGGLAAAVLERVVFAPLSFHDDIAWGVAVAMGFSLVGFASGTGVRLYRAEKDAIETPLVLLLAPLAGLARAPRFCRMLAGIVAASAGCYLLLRASHFDWGYLGQSMLLLALGASAWAFFYMVVPAARRRPGSDDRLVVAATVVLCFCLGVVAAQARKPLPEASQELTLLEGYGNYDVGLHLVEAALERPSDSASESLYAFLARNTNVPRSVHIAPVSMKLVDHLTRSDAPKPNVFIFVIDSLRRDYLSVYNPKVNFTPNLQAFGGESRVVGNAFARYAGTALSEPSIWTGSLLLHQHYITPFYPMNALQKLLEAEGYRQFITKDEILSTILAPSPHITELDAGRSTMDCELCRTVQELESKLDANRGATAPFFSYTQPQNLHISVINRANRSVPGGRAYPGFDAAYAERVEAADTCFGQFIRFLKQRGLYDNSIVIVTSDHGDSLGEEGRWGHAYYVTPEVVRVPLIVHLPSHFQGLTVDDGTPAFLTDITPSIYYLLGQRPVRRGPLFGRPLFLEPADASDAPPTVNYLIASSYAPVYGLLGNDGHSLYVIDGISYQDSFYAWTDSPAAGRRQPVSPSLRAMDQQKIRSDVEEVGRFYHFSVDVAADP